MDKTVRTWKLNGKKLAIILWVVFFCYSVCMALVFQKVLLQLIPSMQAEGGLLPNDSVYFHSVAMDLAEQIRQYGWSAWKLYPNASSSVNTAVLGALYSIYGYEPALAIPLNAALHALGGVLVYLICYELSSKPAVGIYAGVISSALFVTFPSALNWYGQIHKDGYVIAGTLLILLSWVKVINLIPNNRNFALLIIANLVGVVLVLSARPYNGILLLVATLGALIFIALFSIFRNQYLIKMKSIIFFLLSALIIIIGMKVALSNGAGESELSYSNWESKENWKWNNSLWLPDSVERYIINATKTRVGLIASGISKQAKSMIDPETTPQSVGEVLVYLPRALEIGLYAPFPSHWFSDLSITKAVAAVEMFVYYLSIPGVFLLLLYNRRPAVWFTAYFACFFLLVYGFTIANLGTLYRVRYCYLFVMLSLGVLGWITWLDKTNRLLKLANFFRPAANTVTTLNYIDKSNKNLYVNNLNSTEYQSRKSVMNSSFWVMALTLLSFVGFFIRDILMARNFGFGLALDNFFVALMIPMFIVTVFSIPLGNAFIPIYLDLKQRLTQKTVGEIVSGILFLVLAVSLLFCALIYWYAPTGLSMFYIGKQLTDIAHLTDLLHIALTLLLFSGIVILGNAILNAHDNAVLTSGAQLIVPLAAIVALLMFRNRYGVSVVLYGMVVGQLLNLLIVQLLLKRYKISLVPKLLLHHRYQLYSFFGQYYPQVISALFIALTVPAATLLAMTLPDGAVSAFNLGSKVVLFITGLVTAVITAVILPYFSSLVVKSKLFVARRELSLFLIFSTFISVPVSFGFYVYSEQIIGLIFKGGNFRSEDITQVVRVMQYSVVQLPFFICSALLLKFAVATKHLVAVCSVAIIGLLITTVVGLMLMSYMGVAGIAFAISIAIIVSTVVLVLVMVRYWHIGYFDALILFLSWMLFVTLLMGVHFQSKLSIYLTIFAYTVLTVSYLRMLRLNDIFKRWIGN